MKVFTVTCVITQEDDIDTHPSKRVFRTREAAEAYVLADAKQDWEDIRDYLGEGESAAFPGLDSAGDVHAVEMAEELVHTWTVTEATLD